MQGHYSSSTLLSHRIAILSLFISNWDFFSLGRYYRGLSYHYYTALCTTAHYYLVQTRPHYYPCINPHILYHLGTSCTCQNDIKRMHSQERGLSRRAIRVTGGHAYSPLEYLGSTKVGCDRSVPRSNGCCQVYHCCLVLFFCTKDVTIKTNANSPYPY